MRKRLQRLQFFCMNCFQSHYFILEIWVTQKKVLNLHHPKNLRDYGIIQQIPKRYLRLMVRCVETPRRFTLNSVGHLTAAFFTSLKLRVMNSLNNLHAVEDFLRRCYHTVIVTDIIRKDGESAQMITLISHKGMFDETVMGINKALRSGGKAHRWQNKVYAFKNGQLTTHFTYIPVCVDNDK